MPIIGLIVFYNVCKIIYVLIIWQNNSKLKCKLKREIKMTFENKIDEQKYPIPNRKEILRTGLVGRPYKLSIIGALEPNQSMTIVSEKLLNSAKNYAKRYDWTFVYTKIGITDEGETVYRFWREK